MARMASSTELFLRAIIGRAYPRVVGANRELSWLVTESVLPLLGLAAYVFIYKAMNAPPVFVSYVVLGGAMTAYWLNVLWSMAAQWYWEKETANLQLCIMAPASPMAILLGMGIGGLFATTIRATFVILVGSLIFGVTYQVSNLWMVVLVFFLAMVALYGVGMLLASLFLLSGREAWNLSNMLQEPVYLVSGFYFPVRSLGVWGAAAASVIPLTLGLDAMRQLLFMADPPLGFLAPWVECLILLALCPVFLWLAKVFLAKMERLARIEGRLTLRWQ
jgi:ABC-2 type transport system permease protein